MTNSSFENDNKTISRLIEKKKMPKLWSCIVQKTDDEKISEKINKKIDAKLKKDNKIYKATYRLLLLGLFI